MITLCVLYLFILQLEVFFAVSRQQIMPANHLCNTITSYRQANKDITTFRPILNTKC